MTTFAGWSGSTTICSISVSSETRLPLYFGGTVSETFQLTDGNFQVLRPSLSPDGRYVVCQMRLSHMTTEASYDSMGRLHLDMGKFPYKAYDSLEVIDLRTGLSAAHFDPRNVPGPLYLMNPRLSPNGQWVSVTVGQNPRTSIALCSRSGKSGLPFDRLL